MSILLESSHGNTHNCQETEQSLQLVPVLNQLGEASKLDRATEIVQRSLLYHPCRLACDTGEQSTWVGDIHLGGHLIIWKRIELGLSNRERGRVYGAWGRSEDPKITFGHKGKGCGKFGKGIELVGRGRSRRCVMTGHVVWVIWWNTRRHDGWLID